VSEIAARGRVPILCGGTGLYFKAWLSGLGEAPPSETALRAELEATPPPELLAELERRDPETFRTIDRANPRRVVRALEVIRLTGRPFSAQRAPWTQTPIDPAVAGCCFGVTREPGELRRRIDARVDGMFRRGLVEETRALLSQGLEQNRTAMQAIGYRQAVEHLRGERSLPDTLARVKQKTWQYARRQKTWFTRQFPQLEWMTLAADADPSATVDLMEARWRALPR
jgi:tRNA dimethylallyltransferase